MAAGSRDFVLVSVIQIYMKRILPDPEPEPAAADREGEDGEEGNLSADDAPADRAPTFRRGARASYYRKVAKVERATTAIADHVPDDSGGEDAGGPPSLVPPVPRIPPALPTIRSAHEQLLDACEEGDVARVRACLAEPDVDRYLNLDGVARGIVVMRCPKSGGTLDWGHPELLACGRGDTPLRYASFHGYLTIVKLLLEAGAVPGLRNVECKSALALAQEAGGLLRRFEEQQKALKEKHEQQQLRDLALKEGREPPPKEEKKQRVRSSILAIDLPRGDPAEHAEVVRVLEAATAQQWLVVNYHRPEINGRIAQITSVAADGLRCAIIDDAEASKERPFYLKSAVRSATLTQSQLRKVLPPKPPLQTWPLNARFGCMLAGRSACACAFGPCTAVSSEEMKAAHN